jgi:type IV secretory pathway TraG/TraD family ATPase VirD4
MLSDSRGVGVQWVLAVQSIAQLVTKWGTDDAEQILSNLNAYIIFGGLLDRDALDMFSALCGATDVTQVSSNMDAGNVASGHSVQTMERPVLRAEEIRHLEDGRALVLLRNVRPMIVDMLAWSDRPDGKQLARDKAAASLRRREHAAGAP